jgi:hypothetical protein
VREIADDANVRNEAQTLITQLREMAAVASQDVIVPQDFLNLQGVELAP